MLSPRRARHAPSSIPSRRAMCNACPVAWKGPGRSGLALFHFRSVTGAENRSYNSMGCLTEAASASWHTFGVSGRPLPLLASDVRGVSPGRTRDALVGRSLFPAKPPLFLPAYKGGQGPHRPSRAPNNPLPVLAAPVV